MIVLKTVIVDLKFCCLVWLKKNCSTEIGKCRGKLWCQIPCLQTDEFARCSVMKKRERLFFLVHISRGSQSYYSSSRGWTAPEVDITIQKRPMKLPSYWIFWLNYWFSKNFMYTFWLWVNSFNISYWVKLFSELLTRPSQLDIRNPSLHGFSTHSTPSAPRLHARLELWESWSKNAPEHRRNFQQHQNSCHLTRFRDYCSLRSWRNCWLAGEHFGNSTKLSWTSVSWITLCITWALGPA